MIQASNLRIEANYTCRFVRVGNYGFLGATFLETRAVLETSILVRCLTPQWGSHFEGSTARVLLVESPGAEEVIHPRVEDVAYNFSFFTVWDTIHSNFLFGARGGDTLNISGFGFGSSTMYAVAFENEIGSVTYGNCSMDVSPQLIQCVTPAWGIKRVAMNVPLSVVRTNTLNSALSRTFDMKNNVYL